MAITILESIEKNKFVERKPNRKDEQFYYKGIWWNISNMLQYIQEKGIKPREYPIDLLRNDNVEVDELYAMTADTTKPGIVIQLTPEFTLLVDGHHRMKRAITENHSDFKAYHLGMNEHVHFITDKESLKYLRLLIGKSNLNVQKKAAN